MTESNVKVDLLILGAGWTSTFLIPLCISRNITYTATSRPSSPKPLTIPFEFDPLSNDPKPFEILPSARTILITFPIKVKGGSERLVKLYEQTHTNVKGQAAFIQLGSSGIWDGGPTLQGKSSNVWFDRHSAYDKTNDRAAAEDELLTLSPSTPTTVLNLCGLWGGQRSPKNWVGRVAPTKETLKNKGSIHLIHGEDVARAVLIVHEKFYLADGQRWLLTDGRVYDWWDLASAWGDSSVKQKGQGQQNEGSGQQSQWVRELMVEEGIKALPRSPEQLGRAMDSKDFWNTFELEPVKARVE